MSKKRRQSSGPPARPPAPGAGPSASPSMAPRPPPSHLPAAGWRRNVLRAVLAVGAPALLLAAAEGGLRLAGYGYPTSYFVMTDDGHTLAPNRRFGWQFMRRETATQPYPATMPARKPAGVRRIFTVGESAAQGTPAPAFGFGRILEEMLRERFPGSRFEVVNVAVRGINSHVVRLVVRECARLEPDAFLVYMGNNELVGLHSPSPDGLNVTPCLRLLRLGQCVKRAKLAQMIENLIRAVRKDAAKRPEQDMAFFRRRRLAADDPRRQAVYGNLRANLEDICGAARRAGAKVIVSTMAANLQDFPPLASLHRANLAPAELAAWESAWAQATNAEARGQSAAALTNYLDAARLDDRFAELRFRLARRALAAGQKEAAQKHFGQAPVKVWKAAESKRPGSPAFPVCVSMAVRREARRTAVLS